MIEKLQINTFHIFFFCFLNALNVFFHNLSLDCYIEKRSLVGVNGLWRTMTLHVIYYNHYFVKKYKFPYNTVIYFLYKIVFHEEGTKKHRICDVILSIFPVDLIYFSCWVCFSSLYIFCINPLIPEIILFLFSYIFSHH